MSAVLMVHVGRQRVGRPDGAIVSHRRRPHADHFNFRLFFKYEKIFILLVAKI